MYCPDKVQGLLSQMLPLVKDMASSLSSMTLITPPPCHRWRGTKEERVSSPLSTPLNVRQEAGQTLPTHALGADSPETPTSNVNSSVLPR